MKPVACALTCAIALGAGGCGKRHAADEARGTDYDERDSHDERDTYEPDPTEIPLTVDFEKAVKRKIRADNYREELARIERELKVSTRQR